MDIPKDAPCRCPECGRRYPARERIVAFLNGSTKPFTAPDIAEAVDRSVSSVSLTCAVLALEGRIYKRKISGAAWFGKSAAVFYGRDYWLQSHRSGKGDDRGWVTFRLIRSEFAARQEASYWSKQLGCPVRLVHRGAILHTWNLKEQQEWLHAKRTLVALKKALRSRSPRRAFTPAHSSPA